MSGNNQAFRNEKPQSEGETQLQGRKEVNNHETIGNYNVTNNLKSSRGRYDKGMELYESGRVSIGPNGLFKVSGFEVDTEGMQCDCPDHRTRKQTCKHLFAAMLFVKNRGKQTIQHLNGFDYDSNGNGSKPYPESKNTPNKTQEAHTKEFDRQARITRLAVLNAATEILKTHRKPIEFDDILSIAAELEKWAKGVR